MKKRWMCLLLTAIAALFAGGCGGPPGQDEHTLSFLSAAGTEIVDESGEKIMLRGVNAGGLGVTENWMCGFSGARDFLDISRVFVDRFGFERTEDLWYNYRSCWWTEQDFINCAEMGINVIRLPFTYMNVDFAAVQGLAYAGKEYDFEFLDSFVDMGEKYGIYTILDLHGAYGSQNGQDHSGEVIDDAPDVDFYSNEEKLSLTEKLWREIAEHFKDNPAVAGYDLLNEPGEKAGYTSKPHFDAMDRFYRAVRATGDRHLVIFESCWGGKDIPMPAEYGWENCMYSFHHYTNCSGTGREGEHIASFSARIAEVEERQFGVPLQMGEFTCYESEQQWEDTLALLNDCGWHWTSWTYKVWGHMGWGIYNIGIYGEQKVNVRQDTFETIDSNFHVLETADNGIPFAFSSGRTLFSVVRKYSPRAAEKTGEEI